MGTNLKELWQCPKCGQTFVTKNIWHSCGRFKLEDLFSRSEPLVFQLYKHFVELVESCGPVTITPLKTRIAFQARVRFAFIIPRKSYLQGEFWFTKKHEHPRFQGISQYSPQAYGHVFRIRAEDEFNEQFTTWIREAYEVGEQKHLNK